MEAAIRRSDDDAREDQTVSGPTAVFGGKYLTFLLADEEYGIETLKVREIIGIMDITRMPQSADFVRGVINLRGQVIPVIDLRSKFGLAVTQYNDQTCVIVVDIGVLMGVVVDTVQEVQNIPSAEIEEPPKLGASVDTNFIRGMGKVNGSVTILLDIDSVLTSEELVQLDPATDR